ncbi:Fur family transcriptional regulator [Pseudodesulfovibrio indicus]|uniref:Fur family transcriptional regulator n=1 Tax=Pseudodesulfovibrio indicus TaxID=1716143 RepID=UPI002930D53D|nr:Fur family transcriptional regulator [Pseudodesulfovibrio indicus]
MQESLKSFHSYLTHNNLKLTKQRMLIFKVFMSGQDEMSPEDLLNIVQDVDEGISRSTIYRTLKHLHSAGIARCIHRGDGTTYYEPMGDQSCRMICERCGRTIPIKNPYFECIQKETARQQGFTLFRYQCVIHGLCSACIEQEYTAPPGTTTHSKQRRPA